MGRVELSAEEVLDNLESGYLDMITRRDGFRGRISTENMTVNSSGEHEGVFKRYIEFISENATIAGFYKFVPAAKAIYSDGSVEMLRVYGVFWTVHRHLLVFLVYPYFNGAVLEHDPSIGLSIPEAEHETPEYNISIAEEEISAEPLEKPQPTQTTQPSQAEEDRITQKLVIPTLVTAVIMVIAIAVIVVLKKR